MTRRNGQLRRGVAMILVLAAVAMASVLSFALLSSAMLQTRTRGNAGRAASADYLAESGINLAMYYLQHPELAPALNSDGYWAGTGGNVTIGSGTVSVTVTRDATNSWAYEVSSVGTMGTSGDAQMTRTTSARLYVRNEYKINYAAGFNLNTSIPALTYVTGDVICPAALTLTAGSTVSGGVYCVSLTGNTPAGGTHIIANTVIDAPTTTNVNQYRTYTYSGATYTAGTLSSGSLSGSSGVTTLTSSSTNPAGIWVYDGTLSLGDYVTVDGTLVVNGKLIINGRSIVVTPKPNYPALVVIGDLQVNHPSKSLTANGVVFFGGQMKVSGSFTALTRSTVAINGGLLGGGSTPIHSGYNALTTIQLNTTMNKAPELSSVNRTPTGVTILRWGPVVPAPY